MWMVCIDPDKSISIDIVCPGLSNLRVGDDCAESFIGISIFHTAVSALAATSFSGFGIKMERDFGVRMFRANKWCYSLDVCESAI